MSGETSTLSERLAKIEVMSHEELARLWRFAPVGDPLMQESCGARVEERLKEFGGIPPELSKRLGW